MREIKFRGQCLNGDWVYGLLCKPTVGKYAGETFISNSGGIPMAFSVRPETVGQFTGLLDKNGVDVFEGDIVSWSNKTYTIKWHENIAAFVMEEDENKLERPDIEFQSKVIGNIYESKHLIDNTDTKV